MQISQISSFMTKNVISVQPDCLLKDALQSMQQNRISFIIVAENNKPIGVLSERDIVRLASKKIDPAKLFIKDVMTTPVITVTDDADIFQVYDLLNSRKIRHMVVVDTEGHILGLATLTNILGGLSIEFFVELKQVENIMTEDICTLSPNAPIQQALELMTEKRISCVIIIADNKPVGIITERDVTRLYGSTIIQKGTVEGVMSQPVSTIGADTFIPQANAKMQKEKLRHLVIIDSEGCLAGLISQTDIVRRIEEHYLIYLRSILKRQDKKLKYEHERFSILFEQNPNAVISYDNYGNIVNTNQAYSLLSGYDQQEMIGKGLDFFVHPDDITTAQDGFNKACEENTGFAEFRLQQKSGRTVHVFNSYLPIYADHHLHRIYSIMHDVSDTKKAQQLVRKAEEKTKLLSLAVQQAGDSVIITDNQGTIEFVNAAFTKITGFTSADAIGNNPSFLKSGEQEGKVYKLMWDTITKGKAWQARLINRHKNGEFFTVETTISAVQNDGGEITHFIGIMRDLTEREELEQKFRQSQKMEAIGRLVGGIAHDFNNLLAGITGNLYIAKKHSQDNHKVLEKLERIESLSFRGAEMIKQLLAFSRKDIVCLEQMFLANFIQESMPLFETSIPENIGLNQHISNDQLIILGDKTQLYQVLLNLINNARDALDDTNNPQITIRLEKVDADETALHTHRFSLMGSYAHLSIEDNGCGIPEHEINHLFEPFFTTKAQGKGTGLGLSMVFGAIETHQGFIDVRSVEGEGSTFNIYLPLVESKELPLETKTQKQSTGGNGELILLADDQQSVRETTAEVLEMMGYRVLQAKDGREAVSIFEKQQENIAMVLLDVVMPELSGIDAAIEIRKLAEVPLLFMTGYDKEQMVDSEENFSRSAVLSKPVCFDDLSLNIQSLLG